MVSLKGSYIVKPAEQTPNDLMCLSDCDQTKAITHAPTVYFYRPTSKFDDAPSTIDILRDSLSKALVVFYPLAGRLHLIDGRDRLELHCNSMGALLLEAESETKIEDYGDFAPTPQIRALIPSVDYNLPIHELPLVLVQLTKFSCGGISIGLGISHVLVDGWSALHFVAEWSKIALCEPSDSPPFHDRSLLLLAKGSPSFDHIEYNPPPLLIGQSDNLEERKKETLVTMLKLSKHQIDKLKKKANEGKSSDDKNGRGYSRYEAVAGHMWKCACRARKLKSEQQTRLFVGIDFRRRLKPPLPKWYFGNATTRTAAIGVSGLIVSEPLCYASSKIREAIDRMTDEYLRSSLAFLRCQEDVSRYRNFHTVGCSQGAFYGNPNLEITTWASLPVYGADFGWGKEIHMGPGSMGFDGKSFILPDHDEDGSFIIALRLQVPHMDAFRKFFYEDI